MNIHILTTAEEALMKVIWTLESAFMKEIIAAYPEPKPHTNTISTYLKILTQKEFLNVKKIGRVNKYEVAIHYQSYKKEVLKNMISNYFDGFGTELIQFLLHEDIVTTSDLQSILKAKNIDVKGISESEKISDYLTELISKSKKKSKKKKKKKKK